MKKLISALCMTAVVFCALFLGNAYAADWFSIRPSVTDEEFFGVWDGTSWTTEPKLDYSYNEYMAQVGDYAKQGDYSTASSVMFEYCKNKKEWYPWALEGSTKPGLANLVANGLYFNYTNSSSDYVAQTSVSGTEWQKVEFDVTDFIIYHSGRIGFFLAPLQKSDEEVLVSSIDSDFCPKLTVQLEGLREVFTPVEMYTLSPLECNRNREILSMCETGMPYNDNSKKLYVTFDVGTFGQSIVAASLEMYVKSYTDEEIILPLAVSENANETNPTWMNMVTKSYNFYGATGDDFDWRAPMGATDGWSGYMARMGIWEPLVKAYVDTKDEIYAEAALKFLLDMMYDMGKSLNGYNYTGGFAANGGGWPSSIDVANRMYAFIPKLQYLMDSKAMTPDRFIEILKNIYLNAQFLRDRDQVEIEEGSFDTGPYGAYGPINNFITYQAQGTMAASVTFPEFAYSDYWLDLAIRRVYWVTSNYFVLKDGATAEAAPLYARATYSTVGQLLGFIPEDSELYDEFVKLLLEFGEYTSMQALSPAGEDIRYGDSPGAQGVGSDSRVMLYAVLDHVNSDRLQYFYTKGEKGTVPEDTSRWYPIRQQAFLRSGWDNDDSYLFINNDSNGYNSHAHPDDLHITAASYGHTQLIDAGTNTYTTSDIDNWIRLNTEAHNTITINGKSQLYEGDFANDTFFFTTQNEFDFWQGNTKANPGFIHTRSVAFVRPGYWIVSDYVDPLTDLDEINNYRQTWHSSEDFYVNGNKGRVKVSDSYLQVVQSDTKDMITDTPRGYIYAQGHRYLKYMRSTKNVAGRVTYDTILYPSRANDPTNVTAEKLDIGTNATASKITFDTGNMKTYDYYYMSYLEEGQNGFPIGFFDKYTFDGKVAVCENDASGNTIAVNFAYGTTVTENGNTLVESDKVLENITVEWDSNLREINVTSADNIAGATLRIYAPNNTEKIVINDIQYSVSHDGDHIIVTP